MFNTQVPHSSLILEVAEVLHLVTNVQLLNTFHIEMSNLYVLAFEFLDKFPITHFVTKAIQVIW